MNCDCCITYNAPDLMDGGVTAARIEEEATDPTPLQERVAEELYYDQHPEGRHRSEWPAAVYPDIVHEYRDLAAAVLPIIRAAQADAWDGCADVAGDEMGVGGVPHAVKLRRCNPYRADQIEKED